MDLGIRRDSCQRRRGEALAYQGLQIDLGIVQDLLTLSLLTLLIHLSIGIVDIGREFLKVFGGLRKVSVRAIALNIKGGDDIGTGLLTLVFSEAPLKGEVHREFPREQSRLEGLRRGCRGNGDPARGIDLAVVDEANHGRETRFVEMAVAVQGGLHLEPFGQRLLCRGLRFVRAIVLLDGLDHLFQGPMGRTDDLEELKGFHFLLIRDIVASVEVVVCHEGQLMDLSQIRSLAKALWRLVPVAGDLAE